ncbi:hypothetical protein VCRA2121O157_230007 [Vibrio crassostreae]|nr:hypothetical protein VCRA2113O137_100166 [Vibrio crassostreae]CAK1756406.1 hypothetical protein VCRA2118O144_140007 [Vibrio crassostreae]CAK2386426.1 hypothetical protein VCRA2117O142_70007 [Vibrio crassostreae]CAK2634478.1 hypothetical protein VCRA2120O151_140086 [Vibrio crassostreae]CAK2792702.1 hypothetical protein VCRA2113O139_230007 [Vibrio crassostreae]
MAYLQQNRNDEGNFHNKTLFYNPLFIWLIMMDGYKDNKFCFELSNC